MEPQHIEALVKRFEDQFDPWHFDNVRELFFSGLCGINPEEPFTPITPTIALQQIYKMTPTIASTKRISLTYVVNNATVTVYKPRILERVLGVKEMRNAIRTDVDAVRRLRVNSFPYSLLGKELRMLDDPYCLSDEQSHFERESVVLVSPPALTVRSPQRVSSLWV